jgi:hypothetical protein
MRPERRVHKTQPIGFATDAASDLDCDDWFINEGAI